MRLLSSAFALAAFAPVVLALLAGPAVAADLTVTITNAEGQPLADAVATLKPASAAAAPQRGRLAPPYAMVQQNIHFEPFVLIVPEGADVSFPNRDKVRHHVYSFSAAKRFELKLYGKDESRSVHFDKAGVVALGCNIHDQMAAFIDVVDTPFAAKSEADGAAVLHDAPAGSAVLTVWHPFMKASKPIVRTITLPAQGAAQEKVTVDIRIPAGMEHMH